MLCFADIRRDRAQWQLASLGDGFPDAESTRANAECTTGTVFLCSCDRSGVLLLLPRNRRSDRKREGRTKIGRGVPGLHKWSGARKMGDADCLLVGEKPAAVVSLPFASKGRAAAAPMGGWV